MKVLLLTPAARAEYKVSRDEVVDVPDAKARDWVVRGIAQPVRRFFETAASQAPAETAEKWPEDLGGGWWGLPDGRKVQGREKALGALRGD